jgi:hypothetical protein
MDRILPWPSSGPALGKHVSLPLEDGAPRVIEVRRRRNVGTIVGILFSRALLSALYQ